MRCVCNLCSSCFRRRSSSLALAFFLSTFSCLILCARSSLSFSNIAVTRAMFEKERELRAQRMRQEKVLRKKARAKEEERLRKQEEHRLQTQRIMQEQQNAIKRRMKEMELAEQVRTG